MSSFSINRASAKLHTSPKSRKRAQELAENAIKAIEKFQATGPREREAMRALVGYRLADEGSKR